MADTVPPAVRSRIMSRIRSRDTRPEMYVRRTLWKDGFRYRLHVRGLPGTPDLVLHRYKVVVRVHGCFWHQTWLRLFQAPVLQQALLGSKAERKRRKGLEESRPAPGIGMDRCGSLGVSAGRGC